MIKIDFLSIKLNNLFETCAQIIAGDSEQAFNTLTHKVIDPTNNNYIVIRVF